MTVKAKLEVGKEEVTDLAGRVFERLFGGGLR